MAHRLPLADIQFIADFAAYARGRGDVVYDYLDTANCAACQFLRDTGIARAPLVADNRWREARGPFNYVEMPDIDLPALVKHPRTFSALAVRLEALIADAPAVERGQ